MTGLGRRRFLGALAGGTSIGVAGCDGAGDADGTSSPEAPSLDPATSWPSFGFDAGNTGHNPATTGPTADATVDWRYDVGDAVSTPVLAEDTVVVATLSHVVAVDATDGTERWRFPREAFPFYPPAVDGDAVYVGDESGDVVAVDVTGGSDLWRYGAGDGVAMGAPTLHDGTLYVHAGGSLHAIDVADGRRRWRVASDGSDATTPAVAGDGVYYGPIRFGGVHQHLHALESDEGSLLWNKSNVLGGTSPCVSDGLVVFGFRNQEYAAYPTDGGDRTWTAATDSFAATVPPATTGDAVVGANFRGDVHCFEPGDGDERWQSDAGHRVEYKPAIVDGTVFVGTLGGEVVGFAIEDGTERWSIGLEASVASSPIVVDGTVYVVADGTLLAIR